MKKYLSLKMFSTNPVFTQSQLDSLSLKIPSLGRTRSFKSFIGLQVVKASVRIEAKIKKVCFFVVEP